MIISKRLLFKGLADPMGDSRGDALFHRNIALICAGVAAAFALLLFVTGQVAP